MPLSRYKLVALSVVLLIGVNVSEGVAGDPVSGYGTLIAVEFRSHDKFNNAVGKLEYTGTSIDIVGFTEGIGGIGIIATPAVYLINEKTIRQKGIHYLKGVSQYGVAITGHIDFHNELKPSVIMLTDGGTLITNISAEGRAWRDKHVPNIVLGQ